MEIMVYLRIIRKRWLLFVGGLIVTVGSTAWFLSAQEPEYESTGTFVVRPRSVVAEDTVRAIDALTRGVQINSTFASIASSDLIKSRARERVDPTISTAGFSTSGRVIVGTNIIELSVRGPSAEGAHTLATALGAETIAYIDELDETFELAPLDPPDLPKNPSRTEALLTIALGFVGGALLGALLAVGAETMRSGQRAGTQRQVHSGSAAISGEQESEGLPDRVGGAREAHAPMSVATFEVVSFTPGPDTTDARVRIAHLERLARAAMPEFPQHWQVIPMGDARFVVIVPDVDPTLDGQLLATQLEEWEVALARAVVDQSTTGADANGSYRDVLTVRFSLGDTSSEVRSAAGLAESPEVGRSQ